MQTRILAVLIRAGVFTIVTGTLVVGAPPRIIPTPHFQDFGERTLEFRAGKDTAELVLMEGASRKEQLAAELIRAEAAQLSKAFTEGST